VPLGSEHLRLRDRAASALEATGLGALVRRVGAWRGLLILNFHQVANDEDALIDPSLWSATQEQLDEQLRFLRRNVEVVGPEALAGGPADRAQVMLTFDDGYRDNHDLALPVLTDHGVPAVFFVTSGFLDQPSLPWWGELDAMLAATTRPTLRLGDTELGLDGGRAPLEWLRTTYETTPPGDKQAFLDDVAAALDVERPRGAPETVWMTWDMVRALRDAGMAIGGHTATHPRLSDLDADAQAAEVVGGLDRLEAELGRRPTLFSYPYGGRDAFDARTVSVVRDAGIDFAFSYYGGYNTAGAWQPYDLRRVSATATATPARRRAMVTLPGQFARW
jgi:peptidoglycan/xylan/chitin deacetylase (PgdA/CDA1 family)